jgi:hypothetical protein
VTTVPALPSVADLSPASRYEHGAKPFTPAELRAIRAYEQRTLGLPDTFDVVDFTDIPGGPDATRREIRSYFDALSGWYCALDGLYSDLGAGRPAGRLTTAGTRYITDETNTWYRHLNTVRREACQWAFGTAGPRPEVFNGIVTFFRSPGIQVDGTIAAESEG